MITKNYIKQCEQAEEIQKEWEQTVGDIFIYQKDIKSGCYFYITEHRKYINAIWLPTQEQLQEILPCRDYIDFCKFSVFCSGELICWNKGYKIYNELWLAFVMYEKYDKIWTGEKWVKSQ